MLIERLFQFYNSLDNTKNKMSKNIRKKHLLFTLLYFDNVYNGWRAFKALDKEK